MIKDGQYLAVHFNFQAGRLSLRDVNPETGKLTKLLGLGDDVWLEDAEFTVDRQKWQSWKKALNKARSEGGEKPKVRQFAEVRGRILLNGPNLAGAAFQNVTYNPHARADFYIDSGQPITKAPLVYIRGRDIKALLTK